MTDHREIADGYINRDGSEVAGGDALDAKAIDGDEMDRLAALSALEYDRERKEVARELGVRASVLDAEVKQRRKGASDGGTSEPDDDEPWEQPVQLDSVLRAIKARLKAHVAFSDNQATVVAIWVAFAWAHNAFIHSPALLAYSPEANSGKTTLLGLVRFLVPRGLLVASPSPAVLFRMIEKWHPTLIADEADVSFVNNPELREVFNSGWTRGSGVPRCHPETNDPEIFNTFGPKAIGMKGKKLPDTTASRCIGIRLKRKKPGVRTVEFEHLDDPELTKLRRQLARWSLDSVEMVRGCEPDMPEGFENRLRSNWRPLLTIADLAGGEWPDVARAAAKDIGAAEMETSIGVALLTDIKAVFDDVEADAMPSAQLVEHLNAMEGRPWSEFGRNQKPITQKKVADILGEFEISPDRIYSGGGRANAKRPRGYERRQFEDAWEAYLPGTYPVQCVQPLNAYENREKLAIQSVQPKIPLDGLNVQKTAETCRVERLDGLKPLGPQGEGNDDGKAVHDGMETGASQAGMAREERGLAEDAGAGEEVGHLRSQRIANGDDAGSARRGGTDRQGTDREAEQDRLDAIEERAAILEFDAGLPREEAEQRAADDLAIPAFLDRRASQ